MMIMTCSNTFLSSFTIIFLLLSLGVCHVSSSNHRTYIVHMAKSQMPSTFIDHSKWYESSLKSVSDSAEMIYTYENSIHGFSTRLTQDEADLLMTHHGVLSVFPEKRYELHTTRTPRFLGLDDNSVNQFPPTGAYGDVIVGVLDTGVWPESKSYSDQGYSPIPSSWKGECETGTNFTCSLCNRKLIGARFFSRGYELDVGPIDESSESKSPRDHNGHGTHTSSTAAGSVVEGANFLGYASGTAHGMSQQARIAVYKICWGDGSCLDSDILAGIDKAIGDKVDVISLSLGGAPAEYYTDAIALGSFAAMERGIFVSCAAGNSGPGASTLSNLAPWITTVGAGTIDRDFRAMAVLGNGLNFSGVSLFKGDPLPQLPFIYAGNASSAPDANLCLPGTLVPDRVQGKIVMCDTGGGGGVETAEVVRSAGGVGMILANTAEFGEEIVAEPYLSPATMIGANAGDIIRRYVITDPNPTASIAFLGTVLGLKPSPVIAGFSSRGPNPITPNILKPDLIAPGVNILAAWTGGAAPTELESDTRRVEFNILSGTSMACPHVSGLAALLKGVHPKWSPAAIRSALMTTAYQTYKEDGKPLLDAATGKPATPFVYGAGHVSPTAAINPGLVYDLTMEDYLGFLCALKYTSKQMKIITKGNFTCDPSKTYSVADLNYPSFAVHVDGAGVYKYTRTVTSVGGAGKYWVKVNSMVKSVVSVEPAVLDFKEANEKKSYTVTFTVDSSKSGSDGFGTIEWSDGKHHVTSPFAITWA